MPSPCGYLPPSSATAAANASLFLPAGAGEDSHAEVVDEVRYT